MLPNYPEVYPSPLLHTDIPDQHAKTNLISSSSSSSKNKNKNKTYNSRANIMPINAPGQKDSGATAGAKFVTSTLGNAVGGLTGTVGNTVGAAGRGLGDTVEGVTGSAGRPVGRAVSDVSNGLQDGLGKVADGVKRAGEWRS